MKITKHIIIAAASMFAGAGMSAAFAQNNAPQPETTVTEDGVMVLPPLFEYPVAPEDLEWTERSNWLVEHFWDNFNFKAKSVGQSQLNHAFRTYVVPLHLADRDRALGAIDALVKKIKKNPMMLLEFTAAAERYLYEPNTAELMIDEAYLPFLRACIENKKVPAIRKARYKAQLQSLENSLVGGKMKPFNYTARDGVPTTFTPGGVPAIIEFGDFDCADCRIARLRLETDSELMRLVKDGKVKILFISPDNYEEGEHAIKEAATDYPAEWSVGQGSGLDDELDLRIIPCLYLIDKEGNIVSKSANTDTARKFAKSQAEPASGSVEEGGGASQTENSGVKN